MLVFHICWTFDDACASEKNTLWNDHVVISYIFIVNRSVVIEDILSTNLLMSYLCKENVSMKFHLKVEGFNVKKKKRRYFLSNIRTLFEEIFLSLSFKPLEKLNSVCPGMWRCWLHSGKTFLCMIWENQNIWLLAEFMEVGNFLLVLF